MTPPRLHNLCRPLPLVGLGLLLLGLLLLGHICRTGAAARLVPPLPLHAPGFTQPMPGGSSMRVIPLAGPSLRSPAAPTPAGSRRPAAP